MLNAVVILWFFPVIGVYEDYMELLNKHPNVTLSIITLWLPIGALGIVTSMAIITLTCFFTGKKATECVPKQRLDLMAKATKYLAVFGIFTAIGFAWHNFNLLDEYGYQYNSKLTKFTPTGIHLVYTKP